MILVIDNYDSFTYNLVHRIGELDPNVEIEVYRNDKITLDEIAAKRPSHIIISPGPCTPKEAGISVDCVRRFAGEIPILGVCLGHQAIGEAFGAKIVRAPKVMHGKTDLIYHHGCYLYEGIPNPFVATRYHSLMIAPETLPAEFEVCAWSEDPEERGIIMGIRHRRYPLFGVQFHPESFLTEVGHELLRRFLAIESPGSGSTCQNGTSKVPSGGQVGE